MTLRVCAKGHVLTVSGFYLNQKTGQRICIALRDELARSA